MYKRRGRAARPRALGRGAGAWRRSS